ncbi:MAG: ribonuclease III [Rhodocyclaceae bacterium]|jgi:ribonuclease-3|nr:ribonuclease III [Rhodocyclaceae bacterium]
MHLQLHLLERALGYKFENKGLLQQAVTHRSYGVPHYERLEFLGDSMLNCVVAAQLFSRFPGLREGDLSRLRANLVRQDTLHRVADGLKLGDYLLLGEGELKSGGFRRPSILADAFEATLGAIFLDSGFGAVEEVILRLYAELFEAIDPRNTGKDPKTLLQELLQGRHMSLPVYTLLSTQGEAHAQKFEVECCLPELKARTTGIGNSRRAAEQEAAQAAIALIPPK